ncbi:ParA family partition ATPase [Phaeospirillum tilakii]|uniref:ParA family partition ATPase n=1 Tax=Phaeospirillum tilakii TaxID=741673 RepID=A0ABW5C9L2_9PROT
MPARILTIAQQKGGAGKTTLAAQLAVAWARAGRRVGLLDIDPQGSLAAWFALRRQALGEEDGLAFVQAAGWRLGTELDRLRADRDLVLIDSPPHAETEVRIAVRAADLILVPVQPSPMDLWATAPTLEIARREKSPALVLLNRAPARGRLVERIRAELVAQGVTLAETGLGNRIAFAGAMLEGRGVSETEPRGTAAAEIAALAAELAARLGLPES